MCVLHATPQFPFALALQHRTDQAIRTPPATRATISTGVPSTRSTLPFEFVMQAIQTPHCFPHLRVSAQRIIARLVVSALFAISTLVFPSVGHAQLLKRKSESDRPTVSDEHSNLEETRLAVPAWERQFFSVLQVIDGAIIASDEAETAANPLVRDDLLKTARENYSSAFKGQKLAIHFTLKDIDPGKSLNRHKQAFLLSLGDPTFPGHEYAANITVVTSPSQARQLKMGSIVRVEGQLSEGNRNSFAKIQFARQKRTSPISGDQQKSRRSGWIRYSVARDSYQFTFYVENVRALSGTLLEEHEAFLSRYQSKLAEYSRSQF